MLCRCGEYHKDCVEGRGEEYAVVLENPLLHGRNCCSATLPNRLQQSKTNGAYCDTLKRCKNSHTKATAKLLKKSILYG